MTKTIVFQIFETTFNVSKDKIELITSPNDIDQWDSLGHVMLIQAIEEKFNIQFELDELLSIEKLEDIVTLVDNKKE